MMRSKCKWRRINRKTPTLTEWSCSRCGQTAYSNNRFAPTNCKNFLTGGYKKIDAGRNYGSRTQFSALSRLPIAPSFIALTTVSILSGYALWHQRYESLAALIFIFSSALITLCIHEFGHALTAYMGGDKSVSDKGYLTLNVTDYADPANSIVLPMLFLIMGGIPLPGGAVYINNAALRSKMWESAVSAAGVVFNAVALIPAIYAYQHAASGSAQFWSVVAFLIYIEIGAILFNLLPIPGFDGFGIIEPVLPRDIREWADRNQRIFQIAPFILFLFPNPVIAKLWQITDTISLSLGVSPTVISLQDLVFGIMRL